MMYQQLKRLKIERISVYFTTPDNSADTTDPGTSPVGQALVDLMKNTNNRRDVYLLFMILITSRLLMK
jgi:hypothetical protein